MMKKVEFETAQLDRFHTIPQWIQDDKFGVYLHWGVFSVPACGPNATWYGYNMYREGSLQNMYHCLHYGDPAQFGYKNFIPMFTAEKFDPQEWAELFKKSGARFVGPVGEHHEGFSMWKTKFSQWNACEMGPHRDIVGELEKSIRAQGLKFMVAMHHAENWYFYPHWKKKYDVSNPLYQGLYGANHNMEWSGKETLIDPNPYIANHGELWPQMEKPSRDFLDLWFNKLKELIDVYEPDLLWFDFGLKYIQEQYKEKLVEYYYEHAKNRGRDVSIAYKWHNLPVGSGIEDIEQGRMSDLAYNFWVTDTTIDNGEAWGDIYNNSYKSPKTIIHYLIDNVSKNGALILSIGPRADGTIPDEVRTILTEIGNWLDINGEAIYGTRPWALYGEGPTKVANSEAFNEKELVTYTSKDIRYTKKGLTLYAICLDWPSDGLVVLTSLKNHFYPDEIIKIEMLGVQQPLDWKETDEGLVVQMPNAIPCDYAYSLKISLRDLFENKYSVG